jgi:DHA1 family bicyclomycin/chloramphenicol resistance-like MFS transporter
MDNTKITRQKSCFIIVVLAITIVEISTDIYVPNLVQYFEAHKAIVNLTIVSNLIGLGISGLFFGPLSDYKGRQIALILGSMIFAIASLGACLCNNIYMLYFWRFVQGIRGGRLCLWVKQLLKIFILTHKLHQCYLKQVC